MLKGEKPADTPVQAPTKYELILNLNVSNEIDRMAEALPSRADTALEI
jgi:putative tryptophan/tyrosine transport system substrate-binding protein